MPPKRKRNARKAPARSKQTGKNATTSVVNAGPSVEIGSSVDSVDAAPSQKKTRNTETMPTPTPRAETTTESCTNTMDVSDEPIPQVVKNSEKTNRSKSSRPDPYTTLSATTTSYIQLRFQLMNFKNVYRIVQLPATFTFANLHTLIQYMFGWSNSHLHRAEVVSNVVMTQTASWLAR